ncbi:MAG: lipocalin family protein [Sedimentisphaerales bacterium]|nr:lipocalin family protein [Sedimentisphaerales bacterium]
MRRFRFLKALKRFVFLAPAVLSGCVTVPSGIKPVKDFDVTRYLGTWYEIARLDHSFERGLSNVSATYTPRADGGINVLNKGYSERSGRWKQAKGRAYFVDERTTGFLKVSFFGPFYGSYVIIALDGENYSYAIVCGPNRSYLWLLARQKTLSQPVLDALLAQAKASGFDTEALIFVTHDRTDGK